MSDPLDRNIHFNIESILVRTKTQLYPVIEEINKIVHEDNRREFNKKASKIYQDIQELQSYVSSR